MAPRAVIICVLALLCVVVAAEINHEGNGHGHHDDHHGGHHGHNDKCVECKDCRRGDDWCYKKCQKSCSQAQTSGVNIENCKRYGDQAGKDASSFACDLTLKYCRGGPQPRMGGVQKVSLGQCGNIAYGICQSFSHDPRKSPCGSNFNGVGKCSRNEFHQFYKGVVDEQCNQKSAPFDKQ